MSKKKNANILECNREREKRDEGGVGSGDLKEKNWIESEAKELTKLLTRKQNSILIVILYRIYGKRILKYRTWSRSFTYTFNPTHNNPAYTHLRPRVWPG